MEVVSYSSSTNSKHPSSSPVCPPSFAFLHCPHIFVSFLFFFVPPSAPFPVLTSIPSSSWSLTSSICFLFHPVFSSPLPGVSPPRPFFCLPALLSLGELCSQLLLQCVIFCLPSFYFMEVYGSFAVQLVCGLCEPLREFLLFFLELKYFLLWSCSFTLFTFCWFLCSATLHSSSINWRRSFR